MNNIISIEYNKLVSNISKSSSNSGKILGLKEILKYLVNARLVNRIELSEFAELITSLIFVTDGIGGDEELYFDNKILPLSGELELHPKEKIVKNHELKEKRLLRNIDEFIRGNISLVPGEKKVKTYVFPKNEIYKIMQIKNMGEVNFDGFKKMIQMSQFEK